MRRRKQIQNKTLATALSRSFAKLAQDVNTFQKIGEGDEADPEEEPEQEQEDPYNATVIRKLNIREVRYGAAAFSGLGYVLYFVYFSFILLNLNYSYGYPQMRLNGSPNAFHSSRYSWVPWGTHYALCFNLLGPVTLMAAVGGIQHRGFLRMNWAVSWLLMIVNVVCIFCLGGVWLFYCDTGWSIGSPCDSPANCCINYASSQGTVQCPVTAGCLYITSWSQIYRWTPYFLSFLWSIFFTIWTFFSFTINEGLTQTIKKNRDYRLMVEDDKDE